jgi:hypothetical protein
MEDPSLLQLLKRYCDQPIVDDMKVLVGQLPEHWPSTVSLIDDTQVVGSVTFPHMVEVVLESRLLPEQVLAAYLQALTSQGARFLSKVPSSEMSICMDGSDIENTGRCHFRLQNGLLHVETFRPEGELVTDIRLKWFMESTLEPRYSPIPSFTPSLDSPRWYLEMQSFSGGGDQSPFMFFGVTTLASTSDVLEYFSQQLAKAGWQRVDPPMGQAVTCITWRVPRPGEPTEPRGTLSALEWPGQDDQKTILVRVEL